MQTLGTSLLWTVIYYGLPWLETVLVLRIVCPRKWANKSMHVRVCVQSYQQESKGVKKNLGRMTYLYYSSAERPWNVWRLGNGSVTYGSVGCILHFSRDCLSSHNQTCYCTILMICPPQLLFETSLHSWIFYFIPLHFFPYWLFVYL